MRWREFSEARRNPERSPKTSPNQVLRDLIAKTRETIRRTRYKNLFVSFTSLPKLGINPGSTYNTPLGIYAYPAEYVEQEVGPNRTMGNVPFAGDQPWVNIFKSVGNIVNISRLREDNELIGYYEDLRAIMSPFEKGEMRGGYMHYEDFVDKFIQDSDTEAKVDSSGGHLWYVTMRCAGVVSERKGISKPTAWNWIFRQLGIDGFIDEGDGIIHENEPTQAVFFSKKSVDLIERVANKYSPDVMNAQIHRGKVISQQTSEKMREMRPILQSGSVDDLIEWLDFGANSVYLRYVPAQLRPQVLIQRPFYIVRMKEPTKKELHAAFTASPSLMADYGQRLLKLLTVDDIVSILRKFNDRMDVSDPTRSKTVLGHRLRSLMADIGDKGNRMDFITELVRLNPNIWNEVEDRYIPYAPGMREEFRELVYKIAKQQNNQYVIDDLRRAGAF